MFKIIVSCFDQSKIFWSSSKKIECQKYIVVSKHVMSRNMFSDDRYQQVECVNLNYWLPNHCLLKKQFYFELVPPWPIELFFQHFCRRIDFNFLIEKFSIEFRKPSLEILISKNFSFDWILNEIRHEHLRQPANSREQSFEQLILMHH